MGDRETVQTEADEGITTVRTNVGDQAEQKENKESLEVRLITVNRITEPY